MLLPHVRSERSTGRSSLPLAVRIFRARRVVGVEPPFDNAMASSALRRAESVFGGIFLVNWAHGAVSGYFAWPAGIGDVITGVMAPWACSVPRGRCSALASRFLLHWPAPIQR